jgi:hypothetical protein
MSNKQPWALAVVMAFCAVMTGCPVEQGPVCRQGLVACGGACVDMGADPAHCGACGVTCAAAQVCAAGACGCPGDRAECFSSHGICTATATDPAHCGACGNACAAGEVCEQGSCKVSCTEVGNEACDGACVNPQTSAQHCGACNNPCGQAQSCREGACGFDVVAACLTNGQVRGIQAGSFLQAPLRDFGSGPQSMARYGADTLLAVDGSDDVLLQADYPALTERAARAALSADPNHLLVAAPHVFVLNSTGGTLQILEQTGQAGTEGLTFTTVGELNFGDNTFPQVMVRVADTLYVTLYGGFSGAGIAAGQKVVAVDVSDPTSPQRGGEWDLTGLTEPFTPGGETIPRPQGIAFLDNLLYVAMNNLDSNYSVAGPSALAVLSLDGEGPSTITLPEDRCRNAMWVRAVGEVLLVSCGGQSDYSMFPTVLTTHTGLVAVKGGQVVSSLEIACAPGATPQECPAPSIGRFDVVDGRVYLGDQAAGRLYVARLAPGAGTLTAERTHEAGGGPLTVCPVDATTGYSNVGDVLGAQSP